MCFRRLDGADQYRWQRFVERLAIVAFVGEKAALLETPQCAIEILGRDRIGDVRIDPMATGRGLVAELARGHYRTAAGRSEEHTSELQSLMRISYAVFCLKKKNTTKPYIAQKTQHLTMTYRLSNTRI